MLPAITDDSGKEQALAAKDCCTWATAALIFFTFVLMYI
jgi:hypothetical protein